MPPVAIAKIGSTSSTLLVAEVLHRPILRRQRLINLFSPNGPADLIELLAEWRMVVDTVGSPVLMAGGEALRRQPALLERVRMENAHWWDLSGVEEGRVAWMAVKAEIPSADIVVDIGGGSTEIITGRDAWSFPVGAAQGELEITPWPHLHGVKSPVFIGGTAAALQRFRPKPLYTAQDALDLMAVADSPTQELGGVDPARRALLPQGLRLWLSILAKAGWSNFMVSDRGLTEGLWLCASLGRNPRR